MADDSTAQWSEIPSSNWDIEELAEETTASLSGDGAGAKMIEMTPMTFCHDNDDDDDDDIVVMTKFQNERSNNTHDDNSYIFSDDDDHRNHNHNVPYRGLSLSRTNSLSPQQSMSPDWNLQHRDRPARALIFLQQTKYQKVSDQWDQETWQRMQAVAGELFDKDRDLEEDIKPEKLARDFPSGAVSLVAIISNHESTMKYQEYARQLTSDTERHEELRELNNILVRRYARSKITVLPDKMKSEMRDRAKATDQYKEFQKTKKKESRTKNKEQIDGILNDEDDLMIWGPANAPEKEWMTKAEYTERLIDEFLEDKMYAIRIDHIVKLEKDYIFETDIGITDNHQATAREVKPTVIAEFLTNHSHLIAHLDIRKAIVMKLQLMEQFCIARGWKRYEFRTKPIHPLSGLFDEKRLMRRSPNCAESVRVLGGFKNVILEHVTLLATKMVCRQALKHCEPLIRDTIQQICDGTLDHELDIHSKKNKVIRGIRYRGHSFRLHPRVLKGVRPGQGEEITLSETIKRAMKAEDDPMGDVVRSIYASYPTKLYRNGRLRLMNPDEEHNSAPCRDELTQLIQKLSIALPREIQEIEEAPKTPPPLEGQDYRAAATLLAINRSPLSEETGRNKRNAATVTEIDNVLNEQQQLGHLQIRPTLSREFSMAKGAKATKFCKERERQRNKQRKAPQSAMDVDMRDRSTKTQGTQRTVRSRRRKRPRTPPNREKEDDDEEDDDEEETAEKEKEDRHIQKRKLKQQQLLNLRCTALTDEQFKLQSYIDVPIGYRGANIQCKVSDQQRVLSEEEQKQREKMKRKRKGSKRRKTDDDSVGTTLLVVEVWPNHQFAVHRDADGVLRYYTDASMTEEVSTYFPSTNRQDRKRSQDRKYYSPRDNTWVLEQNWKPGRRGKRCRGEFSIVPALCSRDQEPNGADQDRHCVMHVRHNVPCLKPVQKLKNMDRHFVQMHIYQAGDAHRNYFSLFAAGDAPLLCSHCHITINSLKRWGQHLMSKHQLSCYQKHTLYGFINYTDPTWCTDAAKEWQAAGSPVCERKEFVPLSDDGDESKEAEKNKKGQPWPIILLSPRGTKDERDQIMKLRAEFCGNHSGHSGSQSKISPTGYVGVNWNQLWDEFDKVSKQYGARKWRESRLAQRKAVVLEQRQNRESDEEGQWESEIELPTTERDRKWLANGWRD